MTLRPLLALVASFAGLLGSAAHADEVTLVSSKDNTLYENASGALSNGSGIGFFAGRINRGSSDLLRRGLVQFDLGAAVPPGSVVTSVSLRLQTTRSRSSTDDVSVHRATADWGEGASDAGDSRDGDGTAAQANDATWLHTFFSTQFWATPGGEFVSTASDTAPVSSGSIPIWSSDAMIADVQSWVDNPAVNFGWVLVGDEATAGSAKRFATREATDPATHPQLTVEFCPPGATAFWTNYGSGFPGTLGIPALTSNAAPVLGTDIQIAVGNSRGANTVSLFVLGIVPVDLPGSWGGSLLVERLVSGILVIPAAGISLPYSVPLDPQFCDLSAYAQFLQQDPGAAKGISNTAGLELHFGT